MSPIFYPILKKDNTLARLDSLVAVYNPLITAPILTIYLIFIALYKNKSYL